MPAHVHAEIEILASPGEVFAFLDDPANAPLILPQLIQILSVEPLSNGGRRVRYTTRGRWGVICEWASEHIEYQPGKRVVTQGAWDGVAVTATREFSRTDRGTLLRADLSVRVRRFGLGWLIEYQWRRPMRAELRRLLAETKRQIESGPSND